MAAYAKGTLGKHLPVGQVGLCAFLVEYVKKHAILGLARHDYHVVEILCTGADERDAAYVYLLDDVGIACPTGNGVLKRVQVDDDEIYLGYLVLGHLGAVAFVVAAGKDAAKHFRVERLYAPAED